MAAREDAAAATSTLGQFEILGSLGQGGMGLVYRAFDKGLGRTVALKVLREDLRSNEQLAARFQREAEAFATLNHPNIVHIYSVGKAGSVPYIAMELVGGKPLSLVMKEERRIEWKRALRIAEQIAGALHVAHEHHIIHRDIKPGNILLGADDQAYVTDFGIAKVLTAETKLTMDGARLGTPQYMSPERCKNQEITGASDIYSLGVMLFQMISGRLPYESSDPIELVRMIIVDPPARLRDFVPDVPKDLERLVAHLIEKKPQNRPATALKCQELCERVRLGRPLSVDESGVRGSLESFREGLSTSTTSVDVGHPVVDQIRVLWGGVRAAWERLPGYVRITLTSAAVAAAAYGLGSVAREEINRDYAIDTARETGLLGDNWQVTGDVFKVSQESPGVSVARLQVPGAAIQSVRGAAGRYYASLRLTGHTAIHALAALGPDSAGARIVWSNDTAVHATPPAQMAEALVDPAGPATLVIKSEIELVTGGREPAIILFDPIEPDRSQIVLRYSEVAEPSGIRMPGLTALGAVATHGPSGRLAVAAGISGASTRILINGGTENAGLWSRIDGAIGPGGEVISMAFVPHGEALLVSRRAGTSDSELVMFDLETGVARVLTQGPFWIPEDCFDRTGNRFLSVRSGPGGESTIEIRTTETGELARVAGPGTAPRWAGDNVVALAKDRRGRSQLYLYDLLSEPPARTQLTYLLYGIGDVMESQDSMVVALTGSGDVPGVVFVDPGLADVVGR